VDVLFPFVLPFLLLPLLLLLLFFRLSLPASRRHWQ
jgi:hypothetical protein